ncbi:MAG: hypothetical protein XD41_2028 [Desulfonauticus sp. 38_4375]|nr:MAG: hypothetical protein XD41_2028 [Desulfonauticus sp. 38_4375]
MKYLILQVKAPQVSFRRPLDLNYQRTLPLPPPTTLLGLAGAALGLSESEIWNEIKWRPLRDLRVSCLSNCDFGKAKDMMSLLKIKSGKAQRSPYFRELLFNVEYTLIYAGQQEIIDQLASAFSDPFYPLSLGREDELIELVSINKIDKIHPGTSIFYGTAIPGDIKDMEFEIMEFEEKPIKIEPAIVENIPLEFKVKKGIRTATKKSVISFLPYNLRVNVINFNGEILNLNGRNFTWMNY